MMHAYRPARSERLALTIALALCASTGALAAPQDDFANYGGDPGGARYSTLTQITKANVGKMVQAWRYDMPAGALEVQPIVIGGVLYANTTDGKVIALDAATGALKWSVSYPGTGGGRSRGFAYWTEGNDRRLLIPAGNLVYALNAHNGALIPGFGDGGSVDLRTHLRGDDPSKNMINIGAPPAIYKNIFITHGGVGENSPSSPGDIRGWDVRTGKFLWSFHTIPHPGEYGYETWPKDAWLTMGGANAWTGVVVDPKTGIVFAATGSPADDFWGGHRLGNNLFGNSLIAIDATTGKRLWHFQAVHHDMWDGDFAPPPTLMTVTRGGRKIDAVAATNKIGFIYIFDRKTGKPLFDIDEVPTPKSDVAGEVASPTQPVPRLPAPLGVQEVTPDTLTMRTPEANAWARAELAKMKYGGIYTPVAKDKETIVAPGFSGGGEWGGMAADPKGILYVNSENIVWSTSIVDQAKPSPDKPRLTFSGYHKFRDPDGYPATATPWGTLNAIDMNTGRYLWKIPFGEYPELVATGMKDTGSESYGGPVVTATGLLFIGATIYDRKMRAYESATGKLLWQAELPYAGNATPAVYATGGSEYVAIAASSARDPKGPKGAAIVAFKLAK